MDGCGQGSQGGEGTSRTEEPRVACPDTLEPWKDGGKEVVVEGKPPDFGLRRAGKGSFQGE